MQVSARTRKLAIKTPRTTTVEIDEFLQDYGRASVGDVIMPIILKNVEEHCKPVFME